MLDVSCHRGYSMMPWYLEKDVKKPGSAEADLARFGYEQRKDVWAGSVYLNESTHPIDKGICSNCKMALSGYDYMFTDRENKEFHLCCKCFDLFSKFNTVITEYCPGCVEDGNSKRFWIWRGTKHYIEHNPLPKGWHYELSITNWYDWKKRKDRKQGHIMKVADDRSEWWVYETINDDWIVENCTLPKFRSRG